MPETKEVCRIQFISGEHFLIFDKGHKLDKCAQSERRRFSECFRIYYGVAGFINHNSKAFECSLNVGEVQCACASLITKKHCEKPKIEFCTFMPLHH